MIIIAAFVILAAIPAARYFSKQKPSPSAFSGENAYQYVLYQHQLGARIPGSEAHQALGEYIEEVMTKNNWQVSFQPFSQNGISYRNVIAHRQAGEKWYIIAAHYDSRQFANKDPDINLRDQPVPGANDGASGVAVLLELARILPQDYPHSISLVFFDAEDQGGINDQEWIMGSTYYAGTLNKKPDAVVILDMVGDEDQKFYYESNSDSDLRKNIWQIANSLGYSDVFIPIVKHSILDDHVPFIKLGIPAVDIIDFEYEYWHTTQDIPRHVAPSSLERVGSVVYEWLLSQDSATQEK